MVGKWARNGEMLLVTKQSVASIASNHKSTEVRIM